MKKKVQKVETMAQLEKLMPEIVRKVNDDQGLMLRAAANPLLALEEMGYVLDKELYLITYRRLRHTKAASEHLNELAEEIYQIAGKRFDLEDPEELEDVLFRRLKLKEPIRKALARKAKGAADASVLASPAHLSQGKEFADLLEGARKVHKIMPPLLEYRSIDAKACRFASRETYERIKNGQLKVPVSRIRLRITRNLAGA